MAGYLRFSTWNRSLSLEYWFMIPIHLSAVTLKSSWVYLSAIQSGRYFLLTAEVLGLTVENVFSKLFLIHSEKKKELKKIFFQKSVLTHSIIFCLLKIVTNIFKIDDKKKENIHMRFCKFLRVKNTSLVLKKMAWQFLWNGSF